MTTINIGDTFNPSGSTPIDINTPLILGKFTPGYSGAVGTPQPMTSLKTWMKGYFSGAYATYKAADKNNTNTTGPYPQMSTLPANGEVEIYLNADASADLITAGGAPDPITFSEGSMIIQPRLMTAAELAALKLTATANAANNFPNPPPQTWLSGAVCTAPFCMKPPFVLGASVLLPPDNDLPGRWPGIWLLTLPQTWPPEIDILESVAPSSILDMTTSLHDAAVSGGSNTRAWATGVAALKYLSGVHEFKACVYPDLIATFVDDVCVQTWPTPADLSAANCYLIINYGIGGASSWPGPLPAGTTKVSPLIVESVTALQMPATYAGAVVPTPTPAPTPTPTAAALITQAQGLLTDALTILNGA